ncbi:hypothetical protein ISS42_00205 [Candidatus Shapirobacteria bacterium]|nr:hypothetical protein [Candidatus Shapirobacteria bacterium]
MKTHLEDLREIAKIRERGQLTIPRNIRKALAWIGANSIIEIAPTETDKVELRPFIPPQKTTFKKIKTQEEIKLLWQEMRTIGKIGRQINLSEFVVKDRQKH